jgi:hypothetical protein
MNKKTTIKQTDLNFLKNYKSFANTKYVGNINQVIKLYEDRKIEKFASAKKLLDQLTGRGNAPKSAIEALAKYEIKEPAIGKIKRQDIEAKTYFAQTGKVKRVQRVAKNYYVSGTIQYEEKYFWGFMYEHHKLYKKRKLREK